MFTILYKGFYIHGYIDKPECRINNLLECGRIRYFKSIRAAKCYITRHMIPAQNEALIKFEEKIKCIG